MSTFSDIPDDLVDILLAQPTGQPMFFDEEQPEIELKMCEHCGACEEPEHCVWSVQCPECYAPPRQHCLKENGAISALHEARHKYANSPYWQIYRGGSK